MKDKKATVKSTGQKVEVYKLNRGPWCNGNDCFTEYAEEQKNSQNKVIQECELDFK